MEYHQGFSQDPTQNAITFICTTTPWGSWSACSTQGPASLQGLQTPSLSLNPSFPMCTHTHTHTHLAVEAEATSGRLACTPGPPGDHSSLWQSHEARSCCATVPGQHAPPAPRPALFLGGSGAGGASLQQQAAWSSTACAWSRTPKAPHTCHPIWISRTTCQSTSGRQGFCCAGNTCPQRVHGPEQQGQHIPAL